MSTFLERPQETTAVNSAIIAVTNDSGRRLSIRLALGGIGQIEARALCRPELRRPRLLVSYVYLRSFLAKRKDVCYYDWALDSGAYSALTSGVTIRLQDYIDTCKTLIGEDPSLTEIFSLDVIGDWKASLKNTEEMWRQGIPAIPCFHINEPEHALRTMAATYPKIALGGLAARAIRSQQRLKLAWIEQCFARVWPKKIHGFGIGDDVIVMRVPFHSIDATSWALQPSNFGLYKLWGDRKALDLKNPRRPGKRQQGLPVRGSAKINVRSNVDWYIDLEEKASRRWRRELEQLDVLVPPTPLTEQARRIR